MKNILFSNWIWKKNWEQICNGKYHLHEQAGQGSDHTIKDLEDLNKRIYFEWSDNIGEFLERYKAIGTSI